MPAMLPTLAVQLAHPLTERGELPVSPLFLAALALCLFIGAAQLGQRVARPADPAPAERGETQRDVPRGGRAVAFWAVRALGLALVVLAATAGRFGNPNQVRNIAPALTVGAGWPLLIVATAAFGRVWWWLNPHDTLARPLAPLGAGHGSDVDDDGRWAPVWWAAATGAGWMLYLTVWPGALDPRTIAGALLLYTVATLAACLTLGRRTWLWRGEVFTVFFGLLAAVRRRGVRWRPPAGAPAVLGVLSGGALFGLFHDSAMGTVVAYAHPLYRGLAAVAFLVLGAVVAERAARRTAYGAAAMALAPVAASLLLALSVARNRLTTSLQLLPITASNPFGGELDLFGTRFDPIYTQPLGPTGPVWVQAGILMGGHAVGIVLFLWAMRRSDGAAGVPRRSRGVITSLLGTSLCIAVATAAAF